MPHIHEKIDYCAETFVVYENKVLLRMHDKLKKWLSVGGHIELDEDPNEAAHREVKEEVGLDIELYTEPESIPDVPADNNNKLLIPPQYLDRHDISEDHEHIAFIYFARAKTNVLKLSDKEVCDECKWFSKEELQANKEGIDKLTVFYALQALEKLGE
ncbi:NUDIX domain-containing protein [Patescibacteria group bacterium]